MASTEHDIYHEPGYVALLGRERGMQPCACFGESKDAAFLLPLLLDNVPAALNLPGNLRDGQSPDGYPGPLMSGDHAAVPTILAELMSFLRSERIITCFIRCHPLLGLKPDQLAAAGHSVERGRTIPIYLDAPYEEIFAKMRQGHRYEIRKSAERGFHVAIDQWESLPDFVRLYDSLMERVKAAPVYRFSKRYFDGFRASLASSAHIAFAMSPSGAPAGGAIFTLSSGIVQYHLATTDPAFEKDAVQKLVVDAIVRWGLENRAQVVHLGGGVAARDDSLLQFKAGFSRSSLAYHTVHLSPDPDAARRAEEAWRKRWAPVQPEAGFFPAYRSPVP